MADMASRQISQLSGGQQRVFLARRAGSGCEAVLMDEPLASVDAATEQAIIDVLRALRNDGRTVVVVHHDLQTVPDYFDHAILINMRVVANGPVEEVFTPDALRQTYGGQLTILSGSQRAVGPQQWSQTPVMLAATQAGWWRTSSGPCCFGIRTPSGSCWACWRWESPRERSVPSSCFAVVH